MSQPSDWERGPACTNVAFAKNKCTGMLWLYKPSGEYCCDNCPTIVDKVRWDRSSNETSKVIVR